VCRATYGSKSLFGKEAMSLKKKEDSTAM
jgi:hypothetical protein